MICAFSTINQSSTGRRLHSRDLHNRTGRGSTTQIGVHGIRDARAVGLLQVEEHALSALAHGKRDGLRVDDAQERSGFVQKVMTF